MLGNIDNNKLLVIYCLGMLHYDLVVSNENRINIFKNALILDHLQYQ